MLQIELNAYTKHAAMVREIIAPMHAVGIAGLFYVRIYADGTIINLANNADWTDFYFNQLIQGQYQHQDIVDQYFTYSGVSLWALNESNLVWQDAKQYFGYSNGVLICEDNTHFREVIGFYSSKNDQEMNQFYINQIDTLKKLKLYFTAQSQKLITQAELERQAMKHQLFPEIKFHIENDSVNHFDLQKQSMLIVMHKDTGLPVTLPPQRSKCLSQFLQGQSIQEIASILQLSSKTIEHYLEMLRKALGCRTSKELILHYAHQVRQ